jgi:D-alanine-D-alanine ligase
MGNDRLEVLPIWELSFTKMPEEVRKIATERLKWSMKYQKKHGINSEEAKDLPNGAKERIRDMCKRVYRNLMLSGYARIDLRMSETTGVHVIEANPNPQLSYDEDFAQSAEKAGTAYGDLIQRILNLGLRWEPTRFG